MASPWITVALVLVSILILNGFAAGVVALLRSWATEFGRNGMMLLGSAVTGFVSAAAFVGLAAIQDPASPAQNTEILVEMFCVSFALFAFLSLPGGLFTARKLEQGNDDSHDEE